jgi:hypothetical protein
MLNPPEKNFWYATAPQHWFFGDWTEDDGPNTKYFPAVIMMEPLFKCVPSSSFEEEVLLIETLFSSLPRLKRDWVTGTKSSTLFVSVVNTLFGFIDPSFHFKLNTGLT